MSKSGPGEILVVSISKIFRGQSWKSGRRLTNTAIVVTATAFFGGVNVRGVGGVGGLVSLGSLGSLSPLTD